MLIARPEYKSIRDLKGKTLGVSTYGATSDVAARMMMKHGELGRTEGPESVRVPNPFGIGDDFLYAPYSLTFQLEHCFRPGNE